MSLDRKGETRTFGNNLVFLFLGALVDAAGDPAALAREFRDRTLRHLKEKDDRASQAQMELCRPLPLALHARIARRSSRRRLGSLFFTNPGPVAAGLSRFFAADVVGVGHFPDPCARPGVCAAVWTFGRPRSSRDDVDARTDRGRARAGAARLVARAKIVEMPV